jgi:hypothetical protein
VDRVSLTKGHRAVWSFLQDLQASRSKVALQKVFQAFHWDLPTYLKFGGYPAPAELINDVDRWRTFIRDSIVEPV